MALPRLTGTPRSPRPLARRQRRRLLLRGRRRRRRCSRWSARLLAGLSDDDPAGIATYSILGADYGYELLWVLALSTAALIVFHELGVRLGIVTGKGLIDAGPRALRRRARRGRRSARSSSPTPARSAPSSPAWRRRWNCSAGSAATSACRSPRSASRRSSCASNFHRVEHILLALSSVFVAYVVSACSPTPTGARGAQGLVVPEHPLNRDALLVAVATRRDDARALGPRLHPVLRGRQAAAPSRTCATSGST